MTKYGVGIIGAGWVAGEYVKVFRDHPLTELVGIYNITAGKATRLMKEHGVEAREYASVDELFDDERLTEALRAIHPPNRTALVLAYVYGYKAREIAELTATTIGTVLARLHRGRKQLERALWRYATERGLLEKGVTS